MPTTRPPKRQLILDAARELFLANGFAGTSMDAVVARAGVSKQTLYRYFPSKVDLLSASALTPTVFGIPEPGSLPNPTSLLGLRAMVLGFARRLTDNLAEADAIATARLLLGEAFRIPELRESVRQMLPARLLGAFVELLEKAVAAGLIHCPRPDLSARMILGPIFSYLALDGFLRADPLPPPSDADLEAIVDSFLLTVRLDLAEDDR